MEKITDKYILFFGGVFDNFYRCKIRYNNLEFESSEQLYMYFKASCFKDDNSAKLILNAGSPAEAKGYGRTVANFDDSIWTKHREECMEIAVYEKFKQNGELAKILTCDKFKGLKFVEASPYDKVWGIGLATHHTLAMDSQNWRGTNLLGQCIDRVRVRIIKEF